MPQKFDAERWEQTRRDRLVRLDPQQTERDDLVACYRSGQISEAAWQEHLKADPGLAHHGEG